MRYALLSDIHANHEALSAVLAAVSNQRIDRIFCLGDMIGYGAEPQACLEQLAAHDAVMVAGNHAAGCIGQLELNWFNDAAKAALLWTRDQLSVADLDMLRRLPLTVTEDPVTLAHSGRKNPEQFESLVDLAQMVETLAACRTPRCCIGHTPIPLLVEYEVEHCRIVRVLSQPNDLSDVVLVDDQPSRRYLLNPGSVGQPRDGDPRASDMVVDTDRQPLHVNRIAYDIAGAQRKIRQAGLPALFADRLAIGR